ncbi:VCBS repeat-containing protein [Streptomyces sp. NBC_01429]|nr:VCBS repeat-containing protein [Streptomyces sp. NBC_01429]
MPIRARACARSRPRPRVRALALALGLCTALLLTGCTAAGSDSSGEAASRRSLQAKNGDTGPARRPVPRGRGSGLPDDFNGDGYRDLVLNDLVKAEGDTFGDDAGIGIVYGSAAGRRLDPAVRHLLTPRARAAKVGGVLPAGFDAEAACDLDGDGYGDLIIATDPPYNGIGMPPVPLQILFGGPDGLSGRAVVLKIPAKARAGNEWPDHPVCGDFDGDGATDLAVTASAGQVSYLRGPFSRTGAPRSASVPLPGGGAALAAPEPKADANGDGYDDLVLTRRAHAPGTAGTGTLLLGGPRGPGAAGGAYRFKTVTPPPPPKLPPGAGRTATEVLRTADFDGDGRPDLVTRTHRGEKADLIALYGSGKAAKQDSGGGVGEGGGGGVAARPVITFSTSIFLG